MVFDLVRYQWAIRKRNCNAEHRRIVVAHTDMPGFACLLGRIQPRNLRLQRGADAWPMNEQEVDVIRPELPQALID